MADVFITYSREERDYAREFACGLEELGYSVWYDARLEAGASFDERIQEELENAGVVLAIWTAKSVRSKWVRGEALLAHRQEKLVQVVLGSGVHLPLPFDALFYITGHGGVKAAVNKVADAIAAMLPGTAAQAQPEPAHPSPGMKENRGFAFLSYAEEDSDFRDRLVEFLRKEGFAYWEFGESDRDYEMLLFLELEKRIAESTLVLSILSESWKSSVWCVKEYFFAKEAEKPVFLLKAKELGPTLAIAGEHFIEFHKDEERGFERLARELKRRGL